MQAQLLQLIVCFLFTLEQQQMYEHCYQEGYEVSDPEYEVWLKITHPIDTRSEVCSSRVPQSANPLLQ